MLSRLWFLKKRETFPFAIAGELSADSSLTNLKRDSRNYFSKVTKVTEKCRRSSLNDRREKLSQAFLRRKLASQIDVLNRRLRRLVRDQKEHHDFAGHLASGRSPREAE